MSRPSKCRCICSMPQVTEFLPQGSPASGGDPVVLQVDEFEVIRLLDYKGFTQEQWRGADEHFPHHRHPDV